MAWSVVREFPDYEISTEGVVRSIDSKTIVPIQVNMFDDHKVRLTGTDGVKRFRSVARLMVHTFLDDTVNFNKIKIAFKDGDRSNLRLSNIQKNKKRVREIKTGLIFESVEECAAHFCLSDHYIYRLIRYSWPDKNGHEYEFVDHFWPDL